MGDAVTISRRAAGVPGTGARATHGRLVAVTVCLTLAFFAVGGQMVRIGFQAQSVVSTAMTEPLATGFARPDIVDRNGRLFATDVEMPSLYADPALVLDRDELVEKLETVLPDLDAPELRRALAEPGRRFVWIKRGLAPRTAQRVHDLGLPGLAFRAELKRAYPAGALAGHVLGSVNVDNKATGGIERYIDEHVGLDPVHGATLSERAPVRLSIDMAVQHRVEEELKAAVKRYRAAGAAGLVLDAATGEVIAAASLPDVDPSRAPTAGEGERADKLFASTFEMGSVVKMATVAMALDQGIATPERVLDVREPLVAGKYTIKDLHPAGRPLSVADIFTQSSNVGAGMLALEAGSGRQRAFLAGLGLTTQQRTELGAMAAPQLPARWDRVETITIAYGHGLAVAPAQFAAAATSLVNGGMSVTPTLIKRPSALETGGQRVVSAATSAAMGQLMRRNVVDPHGTGRRADVAGYEVGGKTGTAEMPGRGGYKGNSVIASFFAAFPSAAPRYTLLVMLFEPARVVETKGQITAGANAAPVAGQIVAQIAPLLGVASTRAAAFDAEAAAK